MMLFRIRGHRQFLTVQPFARRGIDAMIAATRVLAPNCVTPPQGNCGVAVEYFSATMTSIALAEEREVQPRASDTMTA
jgi:hypothetical protein